MALLTLSLAQGVCAQTNGVPAPSPSTDVSARLAKVEQQAADAKSSADNAWMLTSAALVLMMTGPGLGLVLRGPCPEEERARHHDAEFRAHGRHHRSLGPI